ncbi:906_t:CDS:1, partial [Gigaspora rosea]
DKLKRKRVMNISTNNQGMKNRSKIGYKPEGSDKKKTFKRNQELASL